MMKKLSVLFPGQGAQYPGMGRDLFRAFPDMVAVASSILGYSLEDVCIHNPEGRLNITSYTQPALFATNAMAWLKWRSENSDQLQVACFAGHSLGEYNALFAAKSFSFETGLKLVKKRGELMNNAASGAMAAVLGLTASRVEHLLSQEGLTEIDLANLNSPSQVVISGPRELILKAQPFFERAAANYVILNVSAPFHSRYMRSAQKEFDEFIAGFLIKDPVTPVISNVTGEPHRVGHLRAALVGQITSPVKWAGGIDYMLEEGITDFVEIGSSFLTKMVAEIKQGREGKATSERSDTRRLMSQPKVSSPAQSEPRISVVPSQPESNKERFLPEKLGSPIFRDRYNVKYAYIAGSMYRGIASTDLVIRMGRAGLIGFFGAGGLSSKEVEHAVHTIKQQLGPEGTFGVNILADYLDPSSEIRTVGMLLKNGVRFVEASAFSNISPAHVLYRASGLCRDRHGKIVSNNNILAKVSRVDVAKHFLSPPPEPYLRRFVAEGSISPEQAELAAKLPVATDLCVEADSGGHTDGAIPTIIFPAFRALKEELQNRHAYSDPICVGYAGGIGTAEAAAAAFILGADFIVTGSINQCTVEARISDDAKQLLQEMDIQDTEHVPAGDMFEMGARVQVLKRSVFFPARAKRLYAIYSCFDGIDELPEKLVKTIENTYFKRTLEEVWYNVRQYLHTNGLAEQAARAEQDGKTKMALIFKWYFYNATNLALNGVSTERANYQIHCGPALGAFNATVKGTRLADWRERHVDELAHLLMSGAATFLNASFSQLLSK